MDKGFLYNIFIHHGFILLVQQLTQRFALFVALCCFGPTTCNRDIGLVLRGGCYEASPLVRCLSLTSTLRNVTSGPGGVY